MGLQVRDRRIYFGAAGTCSKIREIERLILVEPVKSE